MNNFTLLDNKFDVKKTQSYHISIRFGLSGYTFAILNPIDSCYIVLKNVNFSKTYNLDLIDDENAYYDKIKEIISQDEYLNKNYKSAKFIFITTKSTIVPAELFEITKLKHYFDFNQSIAENESLNYSTLKNLNAYSIFALPSFLTTIIVNKYRNVKFYQQSVPFIEYITGRTYKLRNNPNQKQAHINCFDNFFDIFVTDSETLLLHNSFTFKSKTDLLYHVMNVYSQLGMNPDVDLLHWAGKGTEDDSEIVGILKKHFKNTNPVPENPVFKYSTTFKDIPKHIFVNLFSLYSCA